jgi:hypothetical protein
MYLLEICSDDAVYPEARRFQVEHDDERLRKWALLPAGPGSRELLQVSALACCGYPFVRRLAIDPGDLAGRHGSGLRIGYLLARHAPFDGRAQCPGIAAGGLRILPTAAGLDVHPDLDVIAVPDAIPRLSPALGSGLQALFSLALGPRLEAHRGSDDFQFNDPGFRATRYASLFDRCARVTDPVAFLTRLHYRGVLKGRVPAVHSLERLTRLLRLHLGLDTRDWGERGCDFTVQWQRLDPWQRQAVLPALDLARHMLDAFNRSATPLNEPGLVLLEQPDCHCPAARFPDWTRLMDELFPAIQFLATLPAAALERFPAGALSGWLRLPQGAGQTQPRRGAVARVAPGTVVLVQVDGRLPNLALMKLSRHLQSQGQRVRLTSGDARVAGAEAVYASCVFSSPASLRRVERLRAYYGDALVAGGSGIDLGLRLPPEIEDLPPDLDLYPELGDRAIGFLTRGCPYRCPFCVVPRKEGGVRRVSDLDSLLQGRTRLILLDDNLLAHPDAGPILEDMARRQVEVNFTQTLDIRLLDAALAALLRRVQCANTRFTRRVYHFSLNNLSGLDRVRESYRLLGFSRTDNVEFVCMYGFDTTLEEDVERLRFLRSLPGAYVFMQEYQPVLGGPMPPPLAFFDDHADRRIDALVRILFPQNMKSVERYFRWLSRRYAAQFGRLHPRLVDTIFRYNHRDRRGRYVASLAGTRPLPNDLGP